MKKWIYDLNVWFNCGTLIGFALMIGSLLYGLFSARVWSLLFITMFSGSLILTVLWMITFGVIVPVAEYLLRHWLKEVINEERGEHEKESNKEA